MLGWKQLIKIWVRLCILLVSWVSYLSSCALLRQWSPILLYLPSHAFWYLSNSWEAAMYSISQIQRGDTLPCQWAAAMYICICAQGWRARVSRKWGQASREVSQPIQDRQYTPFLAHRQRPEGHAQRSCAVQPPGTTTIRVRWIELRLWVRCSIFKNKV